jgi:F-box-like
MDDSSIGSNGVKRVARRRKELFIQSGPGRACLGPQTIVELYRAGHVLQRVPIGSIPDDVLLEIFDQVRVSRPNHIWESNWTKLVHVCRRWRFVIFESPLRLKLEITCTPKTPVRKLLDLWPTFPLVVQTRFSSEDKIDNLIAALEHRDRVQHIHFEAYHLPSNFRERIATVMQEPFPELISLHLEPYCGVLPLPNTFLNGSAPRLQHLELWEISFPSLPRLLLTTRDLTSLRLSNIPNSGYIPPETMATSLSVLLRLEYLTIEFQSPTPQPKRRNRPVPPQTRSVLPALTGLHFKGVSEYLEVLVARIDAPLLRFDRIRIIFFNQLVFDIPQTIRFFDHLDSFGTSSLTLRIDGLSFGSFGAVFFPSDMPPYENARVMDQSCSWHIMCEPLDWQVFSMAQICSQILSFRSSVESLVIEYYWSEEPEIDIDPTVWFQLFQSFPSVQNLQISTLLELSIAAALEGLIVEPATEVFPSLHSLSIVVGLGRLHPKPAEAVPRGIQSFVAARQHSGRPVALSRPSE